LRFKTPLPPQLTRHIQEQPASEKIPNVCNILYCFRHKPNPVVSHPRPIHAIRLQSIGAHRLVEQRDASRQKLNQQRQRADDNSSKNNNSVKVNIAQAASQLRQPTTASMLV
jgi:hypothetical protein